MEQATIAIQTESPQERACRVGSGLDLPHRVQTVRQRSVVAANVKKWFKGLTGQFFELLNKYTMYIL